MNVPLSQEIYEVRTPKMFVFPPLGFTSWDPDLEGGFETGRRSDKGPE